MTRGQMGRHWSIQAAEAWGASEEALEFVAGKTGKEQSEREERRRARMRPQLRDEDKVALEAAGRTDLKEAMETVTGVLEDVYVAIGVRLGLSGRKIWSGRETSKHTWQPPIGRTESDTWNLRARALRSRRAPP